MTFSPYTQLPGLRALPGGRASLSESFSFQLNPVLVTDLPPFSVSCARDRKLHNGSTRSGP